MARGQRPRGSLAALGFIATAFLSLFALSAVVMSWASIDQEVPLQYPPPAIASSQPRLLLRSSSVFTLAIFSDLHYGEEEDGWGTDQDINSTRVMNAVLDLEDPIDLVVVNGDLITGENTLKENSSAYIDQIVAPMVARNIPWASTYGNHDSKFNLSREAIFQSEKKYNLSYTQHMDASLPGITNYYLFLQTNDGAPAAILWFFDSRGGASYQKDASNRDDIPNWVANETAQWFSATSTDIRSQFGTLPSIAFVHIPPNPFLAAQNAGLAPARFPGINQDVPASIQGDGNDDVSFVDALSREDLLHSLYVGHDHGDAWCGIWPGAGGPAAKPPKGKRLGDGNGGGDRSGPFLCFSRRTGYGGYGDWERGARIVQLSFEDFNDDASLADKGEMRVDTWVRMEDGEVLTRVTLNETYGKDIYATQDSSGSS